MYRGAWPTVTAYRAPVLLTNPIPHDTIVSVNNHEHIRRNMFSKRHYEAIAKVIKDHNVNDKLPSHRSTECCYYVVADIVDMFERDNPKFDRVRFLDACGLGIAKPTIVDAFIAADKLEIIVVK